MTGKRKVLFVILFSLSVPAVLLPLDLLNIAEITEGHILRSLSAMFLSFLLIRIFFEETIVKEIVLEFPQNYPYEINLLRFVIHNF